MILERTMLEDKLTKLALNFNSRRLETDIVHARNFAHGQPIGIFAIQRRNTYHIADLEDEDDEYLEYFGEGKYSTSMYH